jgi:group I intron endonuclease
MIIYLTINLLNGKFYVGQLFNRKGKNSYLGSGKYILRAIRKYGKENFTRVTLCYCNSQEELNQMEIYWISYFDSTNPSVGYNLAKGGESNSGWKMPLHLINKQKQRRTSQETKEKIRKSMLGRILTEEHKNNISKSLIGSKQTKEAIDNARLGRQKPIIEYDLQMNIIKEWPSALIASKELEIPRTNIGRVLRLQQKSVQNKIFRYKDIM